MVRKARQQKQQKAPVARRTSGPAQQPYQGRTGPLSGGPKRRQVAATGAAAGGQPTLQLVRPGSPPSTGLHTMPQSQAVPWGPLVQLPVLHQREGGQSGHQLVPAGHAGTGSARRPGGRLLPLCAATGRAGWRYRWQLAPAVATAGVLAGATADPSVTAIAAAAVAAGAQLSGQLPERIRGRVWLSTRERTLAASWASGASGWAVGAAAGWWPATSSVGVGLLAAVVGVQSVQWVRSRQVRPKPAAGGLDGMSALARDLIGAWPWTIGAHGPRVLRGSAIAADTMTEPAEGTYVFGVELADTVHAEEAVGADTRRALERALRLPVGTVELRVDRDDSGRVRVQLSPARHLEAAPTVWPGPVLRQDGTMPVAIDEVGAEISVALWNKDGVEHGLISGTSGTGKGGSTVVVVLPGILAGAEVLLYVDGKRGMSAPELAPITDRMAVTVEQWAQLVTIAHAVMEARELRYGARALKRFSVAETGDPVLTLLLDEASTLAKALPPASQRMIEAIAERGRATGIRLLQASQSVRADKIVGGVPVRDLLTGNGFGISHRAGGSSAARLAGDGIQVDGLVEAILALPEEPGHAVISRRGQVKASHARVFDAELDAIALIDTWLRDGHQPRTLTGADLTAAGHAYTNWSGPRAAATTTSTMSKASSPSTTAAVAPLDDPRDDTGYDVDEANVDVVDGPRMQALGEQVSANTDALSVQRIHHAIRTAAEPVTRSSLVVATGLSVSSVKRAIRTLTEDGRIERCTEGWIPTSDQDIA